MRIRACRQRVPLARRARRHQELPHGRREPDRPGRDVRGDQLHRVVDRHPGGHRAAGGVDVEGDVAVGVVGGEQQELGGDPAGGLVVHLAGEVEDALVEEPVEDGVGGGRRGQ
jgi:hypothetical protein